MVRITEQAIPVPTFGRSFWRSLWRIHLRKPQITYKVRLGEALKNQAVVQNF